MIKTLLASLLFLFVVTFSVAQTTILDFETPETSTTFQYFGSTLDGTLNQVIANPNPSGENTSGSVAQYIKPADALVWAGCFSNPNPVTSVDLIANGKVAIKVHMDHIGSVSLKLEGSTDGGDNWFLTMPNTKVNEWETLVFDASVLSLDPPNTAATGNTYARVTLFFDFGFAGTGTDVTYYFDDIKALPNSPAPVVILDFEAPATSTVFQYFGSTLDGTLTQVIANPNPTGINTSGNVTQYTKPAVSQTWAGCFSNPNPETPIDLIANNKVALNVHMDHIGSVSLKLEGSTDGGDNWVITVPNTKVNEWETLVFDPTLPSIEGPFSAAIGHTYTRVVLFFDFGIAGTGVDVTSYFDDIVALPVSEVVTTVLDFETPETSTGFQYFGSTQDGSLNNVIANPNPTGINTSSMVSDYVKPAVAQTWAGAFSNPAPTTPVDLSNGGQVCIKVHMDHIGSLSLKLEGSSTGSNWITTVANTKVDEWEEICFDASVPSIEAPFEAAKGVYTTVVLFFDFGTAGTGTDVTSYFDDIVVKSSGAPKSRTISFKVDMNQYSENFDQVYLSGSFNNWSGDANPLEDPDFDGIWEGSIVVPNGLYEYKVTLDNWQADEKFIGTEECTKADPTGQFVNRLLMVSADRELPKFCFNSCYECGEEVLITFKLGMGDVPPNPDGVWLAGGGNFDVPGGKYKMNDDDGDGIYQVLVPRKRAFSSFYTFANGPCPDYSCKENLAGLACGDPNNFNDRFLPEVSSDTEVATCFGTCFTNAECTSATLAPEEDALVFSLLGNPSSNGFSLLEFGDDLTTEKYITLTSTVGQIIQQWIVTNGSANFTIQTKDLQSGLYFVTVKAGDRFYTRKMVK